MRAVLGAEHARRRLEVGVDLLDERRHDQDHERRRRDQVGEDHAVDRAGEVHLVEHRRQRNAVGDRRHHQRQQEQQHQRALAAETRGARACRRPARRSAAPAATTANTTSTVTISTSPSWNSFHAAVYHVVVQPSGSQVPSQRLRERARRDGRDHEADVDDEQRHQPEQQAAPRAIEPACRACCAHPLPPDTGPR